jgi:DNA topoisomerase-1
MPGMYTLVVCEKPDAARRIAHALGDAKETGASVFDVSFQGKHFKICSASGHLYSVSDATRNRSVYPVLDLEWAPIEEKGRGARVSRIISTISKLAQGADSFVHACDYDQEGEVIGYSILQYACGNRYAEAKRAKFSTLTDDEIAESFSNLLKPSAGLAEAGRSRHVLDFIYGVNLSRALAQSFKAGNGSYRNLSIGRVQGPTLAFAADREREIRLHVPDPYWVITADFEKSGQAIHATYEKPKMDVRSEAQAVADACVGRDGEVSGVSSNKVALRPPTPFNIGDLQREAYRLFKISPGYALAIAEKLYLRALISYPRTSSQKLPASINYRKILSGLAGSSYSSASILLSKDRLVPNEGSMTDPAHPAIYPTGVSARLSGLDFKVYDLVAKRFLTTFGDSALTERVNVTIGVNGHTFTAEGRTTLYEGWMAFYRPYVNLEESAALPTLAQGELLANRQVAMGEKFTQPPWRYSQSSLLAKMELEKIGTKATRADIISTLFKRDYLAAERGGIRVTDLGFAVVESMRERVPAIVSTELTRSMEEQLEKVEQGGQDSATAIEYAVDRLVESLAAFREGQAEIGRQIGGAAKEPGATEIGRCPVCKAGNLRMIWSKATKKRFVGCSNYAAGCRASAPLPQKGAIKSYGKVCKCGWPILWVAFGRGKKWNMCVNMQCPFKKK